MATVCTWKKQRSGLQPDVCHYVCQLDLHLRTVINPRILSAFILSERYTLTQTWAGDIYVCNFCFNKQDSLVQGSTFWAPSIRLSGLEQRGVTGKRSPCSKLIRQNKSKHFNVKFLTGFLPFTFTSASFGNLKGFFSLGPFIFCKVSITFFLPLKNPGSQIEACFWLKMLNCPEYVWIQITEKLATTDCCLTTFTA